MIGKGAGAQLSLTGSPDLFLATFDGKSPWSGTHMAPKLSHSPGQNQGSLILIKLFQMHFKPRSLEYNNGYL
jgi:hypothetical protein